jgi:hypothetical protein
VIAIPCHIEWIEQFVVQQLKMGGEQVRRLSWRHLATIVHKTITINSFPTAMT